MIGDSSIGFAPIASIQSDSSPQGAALEGSLSASSTASGGLTTSISLSGASLAQAAAAAELTRAIGAASASGGFASIPGYRRKTRKQIEDERIALGIIPAPVAKIAEKIAKKAIRKAAEKREPDVLAYLSQHEQQAAIEREMRREMARQRQMWDRAYQRLIEIAVEERLQLEQDNEEALLLLLAA